MPNRKNIDDATMTPTEGRSDREQPSGMGAASPNDPIAAESGPSIDVLVSTDSSVEGGESLTAKVQSTVGSALARFGGRLTRVEVHLSDQNGGKGGSDDKRCMIEARLEGLQPIAVTDTADTLEQAVDGAVGKMKRAIENTLGKLRDRRPMPDLDEEGIVLPNR